MVVEAPNTLVLVGAVAVLVIDVVVSVSVVSVATTSNSDTEVAVVVTDVVIVDIWVVETVTVVIPSQDVQKAVAWRPASMSYPIETASGDWHCAGTARFSKSRSAGVTANTLATASPNVRRAEEERI